MLGILLQEGVELVFVTVSITFKCVRKVYEYFNYRSVPKISYTEMQELKARVNELEKQVTKLD